MDPIDLTHPADADWMRDGAAKKPDLHYREQVDQTYLSSAVRESLTAAVQEELTERRITGAASEELIQEVVYEISDEELEEYYHEASIEIDPEEVDSLEFVNEIDSYVAAKVVDAHLET